LSSAPVTAEPKAIALRPLIRPRSVAIVGVSPEPGSLGNNVLTNLTRIGYGGAIHLVSRNNREIGGRACVAAIDDLPDGVDVAVLAVPQKATIDAVKACVRRGIGAALVFASGFAEMDEAGRAEQDGLARIATDAGVALCGPNCIGLVNLTDRVALTFEPLSLPPQTRGHGIGVVTQSGAMCSTLRLALLAKGLTLSVVVSTGNEAVLTTEHFLEFLIDDASTEVIVLFMEQVRDPARFLALAGRARARKKPIVLMHPGRSARAQDSARTHTGAMVGNHAVMAALVAHQAVVRVETLEELLDTAEILARFANPPVKGAAIMTNSGAFKGYALDFAEDLDLDLPALSPANAEAIKKILPPFAAIENPVDTTAQTVRDPSILGTTAEQLLADPAMGSLVISIVAGAPRFAMDKANAILSGIANLDKPIAVATMGDETELPNEFPASLRDKGLAFFRSPDRALRAMARATWYGNAIAREALRAPAAALPPLRIAATGALTEYEGKALLAMIGIAVPEGALARDPDGAREIAGRVGYPVALKAQAAALAHKTDAGGVALNIADAAALKLAWDSVAANVRKAQPGIALDGLLVEAMAPPGLELVVGARREKGWGTILTLGLGGIWIEALHDIRIVPADLSRDGIIAELRQLKAAALLRGSRGAPAADLDAVADCAVRLGALLRNAPRIAEVEINPLRVFGKGAVALDVLMHVEEQ
jgi:acyl-CoA synthetase (NDP forming)